MTVLVLDSPELIARFEATQASKEVKAEEARVVHADVEVSAPSRLACTADQDTRSEQPEESLALVM